MQRLLQLAMKIDRFGVFLRPVLMTSFSNPQQGIECVTLSLCGRMVHFHLNVPSEWCTACLSTVLPCGLCGLPGRGWIDGRRRGERR
jgi:hypothetical protein